MEQHQEPVAAVDWRVVVPRLDARRGQGMVEQPVQLLAQALLDRVGAKRRGGPLDVHGPDAAVDRHGRRVGGGADAPGPASPDCSGTWTQARVVTPCVRTSTGS